jgi:Bacterial antitoxin of type II TA system, VapB
MARITVDVDEVLLGQAQDILGTGTKVATINAALAHVVRRIRVAQAIDVLNSVLMDFSTAGASFRYSGGRDLGALEARARLGDEERKASA